jgi:hypothetical protein
MDDTKFRASRTIHLHKVERQKVEWQKVEWQKVMIYLWDDDWTLRKCDDPQLRIGLSTLNLNFELWTIF